MSDEKDDKGFSVVDRRVGVDGEAQAEADSPVGEKENDTGAEAPEEAAAAESAAAGQPGPPVTFPTFILSLHASALINLGLIPGPAGGEPEVRLELARESIDLLEVLQEKTKGNLTQDEDKLFTNVLYELRMAYLQVCEASGNKECGE